MFSKYLFCKKEKKLSTILKVHYFQAKSPIRTLDELYVSEVLSTPNFPTIPERKQNNSVQEAAHCTNKSETDCHPSINGGIDLGFGLRKKHRCFVVTARARAFLYHQVKILCFRRLIYYGVVYVLWISSLMALVDDKCALVSVSTPRVVRSFEFVLFSCYFWVHHNRFLNYVTAQLLCTPMIVPMYPKK